MRLDDLFEDEQEHWDALDRTGFYGAAGAGCVFLAKTTGRLLIAHRSNSPPPYNVEQPGTWGCWGGAINSGEDPREAVRREVREEAGYHGQYSMVPLYVFKKGTFRYFNFMVEVEDEFKPILNWESQGYRWCELDNLPQPLHFGLVALFNDPESVRKIKAAIAGTHQ